MIKWTDAEKFLHGRVHNEACLDEQKYLMAMMYTRFYAIIYANYRECLTEASAKPSLVYARQWLSDEFSIVEPGISLVSDATVMLALEIAWSKNVAIYSVGTSKNPLQQRASYHKRP